MVIDNPNELLDLLNKRQLSPLFQPIVNTRDNLITGYEALIRGPSDSHLHSPLNLFDTASRLHKLSEVDLLAQDIAIRRFMQLNLSGKLFLNISPTTLLETSQLENRTLDIIQQAGFNSEQVVIEISEQYPLEDYQLIRKATEVYKNLGFQIAIDDLGAGYAGLRSWSEICPDYVKIDRHFVTAIDSDLIKQDFVRSIIDIASSLKCQVIAEGVETRNELETICQMGIESVQGYFLGRPSAIPPRQLNSQFAACNTQSNYKRSNQLSETVARLSQNTPAVAPAISADKAIEIFRSSKNLHSLAVVSNDQPLGLVYRSDMLELFASRYGRDLHGKKPIGKFLHRTLIVDAAMPVEDVSKLITDDNSLDFSHDFIITRNDQYLGIGHIKDLLKVITDLKIKYARYANPLTGLPGNVPIYETIDRLLEDKAEFYVAYCDLDYFKPYNDIYGYSRGDRVIQNVADILSSHVDHRLDFVGHIGGDDFVVIFQSDDWEQRCRQILDDFTLSLVRHYDQQHLSQGGFRASNRNGDETEYALLSLSIGCVSPDPLACVSHHAVASLATEAKIMAKKMEGNALFYNRRRVPEGAQENTLVDDKIA